MTKFKILICGEQHNSMALLDNLATTGATREEIKSSGKNLGTAVCKQTNSIAAYAVDIDQSSEIIHHGFARQVDKIVVLIDANSDQCMTQLADCLSSLAAARLLNKASVCLTHESTKAQYQRRYKLKDYALGQGVAESMIRYLLTNDNNAVQNYIEHLAQRGAPMRNFMLRSACA